LIVDSVALLPHPYVTPILSQSGFCCSHHHLLHQLRWSFRCSMSLRSYLHRHYSQKYQMEGQQEVEVQVEGQDQGQADCLHHVLPYAVNYFDRGTLDVAPEALEAHGTESCSS
jgi:hypothetical protein